LLATRVAAAAGVQRVLIPGLAAVFSAFCVGFSDISHEFEQTLDPHDTAAIDAARGFLRASAARAMYAEGIDLEDCQTDEKLLNSSESRATLVLRTSKSVPRAKLTGAFGERRPGANLGNAARRILCEGQWLNFPLLRLEEQSGGFVAEGPVVLEESFFTARIDAGWRIECNPTGDILLSRQPGGTRQ
jgi:N-methylhydantoinase A/oxoprolinase/acetone carboxylase beta subunit